VTRRDFLAAGMLGAQGMVIGSAWLGSLLKAQAARASGLDADVAALLAQGQCNVPSGSGSLPFIVFDLAGGANLVGSEALVGVQGGQANFLSTAGYGKLGVPGNMVPTSSTFVSSALGLLWHSDGAILRGILTKASAATQAGTNGAVIPAMSQNDTQSNTINPIYGIAEAGAKGTVVNLVGTQSSVSGGSSAALMYTIQPSLQPTTIQQPSDAIALAPVTPGGGAPDPLALAELESETRISAGTTPYAGSGSTGSEFTGALSNPSGSTPGVQLIPGGGSADAALKNQVRCSYVKAANTANIFATGETRNFTAGQMIGAVLEYASRKGTPVMIQIMSDGSLTSNSMVDTSTAGRNKLGWQGDNSSVAATLFLVYSPAGRPVLRNGVAGQQIGYFSSDGSVVSTSSPAANSVNQIPELIMLNYMGLMGTDANFATTFPMQGLGPASALAAMTVFEPIV
jgi:hypothetical protein